MKPELKKLLLLNLPYLLFVYLFAKCGQAYRLAAGADASAKLLHLTNGISAAFANPLPSLHPFDLCVGLAGAVAVRLIVYSKGKNAKKYRKGEEYGSARWGTAKDIAPYIDPKFENNILLTQTERLTMTGRPKDPKTARNKNVLVIGGSGSGKTRFYAPQEYLSRAYHDAPKYCATIETAQVKKDEVVFTGEIPARCIQAYRTDLAFYTNGRSVCLTELKGYQAAVGQPVIQPRRPNSRLDKVRHMFQKVM